MPRCRVQITPLMMSCRSPFLTQLSCQIKGGKSPKAGCRHLESRKDATACSIMSSNQIRFTNLASKSQSVCLSFLGTTQTVHPINFKLGGCTAEDPHLVQFRLCDTLDKPALCSALRASRLWAACQRHSIDQRCTAFKKFNLCSAQIWKLLQRHNLSCTNVYWRQHLQSLLGGDNFSVFCRTERNTFESVSSTLICVSVIPTTATIGDNNKVKGSFWMDGFMVEFVFWGDRCRDSSGKTSGALFPINWWRLSLNCYSC